LVCGEGRNGEGGGRGDQARGGKRAAGGRQLGHATGSSNGGFIEPPTLPRRPLWESRSMRWGRGTLRATTRRADHDPFSRAPPALPRSAPGVAAAPRRAPGRRPGAGGAGGARRQPLARRLAAVAGGNAAGQPVGAARVPPPALAPRRRRPGAPAAAARTAGAALASVPGVVEGAGGFLAAQRDQFCRAPELVELGRVAR